LPARHPLAIEGGSGKERGIVGDEEMDKLTRSRPNLGHRKKYGFPADMDLETRKAYGRALMSGHGMLPSLSSTIWSTEYVYLDHNYDPALFEDATMVPHGIEIVPSS
jgi:hypothetical protein